MNSSVSTPSGTRSVITFFALAFGISWAVWIPAALASYDKIAFRMNKDLSSLLGVFGPFIAAVITAAIYDRATGLGTLFKRLLTWHVGIQWYLFVLLWPAVLSLAKTGIAILLGSPIPDFADPPFRQLYPLPPELLKLSPLIFLPFVFLQQTLIGSSMGEEVGWRGYALPRLLGVQKPLWASLLLGSIWGVWHLPLWFLAGSSQQGSSFWLFLANLILLSVLYTWLFNNGKGSILVAVVFHAMGNTVSQMFPGSTSNLFYWLVLGLTVLLVVVIYGPRSLVRVRRKPSSTPAAGYRATAA